jgi:hypothetical protein
VADGAPHAKVELRQLPQALLWRGGQRCIERKNSTSLPISSLLRARRAASSLLVA